MAAAFPVAVATHGSSFQKSGTVVTVVPFISGSTRTSCDDATAAVAANPDSDWYSIPSEFTDHTFRFQSAPTLDGDFMFFNADDKDATGDCWSGYNGTGDGGIGSWAYGVVPGNATHVNIWGDNGFGDYKLEIPHPGCEAAPNCPPPSASG